MRIVWDSSDFVENYNTAKSEAKVSFNDDRVYIEAPKHIEVQVLGDMFGNVIHLYERDCSMQRKNQKILEEAPCHILEKDIREKLIEDAVKICNHLKYYSAGTIEFLVDKSGNYYFIQEFR